MYMYISIILMSALIFWSQDDHERGTCRAQVREQHLPLGTGMTYMCPIASLYGTFVSEVSSSTSYDTPTLSTTSCQHKSLELVATTNHLIDALVGTKQDQKLSSVVIATSSLV